MNPFQDYAAAISRRYWLSQAAGGIGAIALSSLLNQDARAARPTQAPPTLGLPTLPHFQPKAKRIIYLFQSGGPSQMDLFDYKPQLNDLHGSELPDSVRQGQRLTEMTHKQKSFPTAASRFTFQQYGESGAWLSEVLPHTAKIVDKISIIRSMHTEAINHDPAVTMLNTGTQQLGKPSLGAWLNYGIGSECQDLPAYIVMISVGTGATISQPLFARLWSSGFLPSDYQGVRFRSGKDPVLFLSDPPGLDRDSRRAMLDGLAQLNELKSARQGDPEIDTRIAQYEMAFRMQKSIPDLMDMRDESASTFALYGPEARKPGTYAANCLLARRMAERGVRFIQLYHRGWDQHSNLPRRIRQQCNDTDQPSAALIMDLEQRGMLEDTLVVWSGEFGRTVYCQGKLTRNVYGRDHHGRCYSMWLAGGGIKGGVVHGATDDYSYNITEDPVHVRDLNATLLHCMGIDHERFVYPHQGLDQRLTGVDEPARVLSPLLA
ncbi:MAG: DUF1501 domain-containing protein [Planctomycetota bacterium]|nr:MAG: DUF1501 domain-containing protein [Planctomycetota bacterium]REJ86968.1 MAG: DUF1501 domain-containing protein [Planctomycetota bacterium]REK24904.1 MAG: DUF1501 domain-containing protein [Planctomycetota bacterium]REK48493.1 MAG: DUF1501 domain-containing protein [Planctomycetota bacterium]